MSTSSQPAARTSSISSKSALSAMLLEAYKNAQATAKSPAPVIPIPQDSANTAVAHCCQIYNEAMKTGRPQAEHAYRLAMPPLSGPENIRDFIACVAHGILLDVIKSSDGARLLYAAQIARGAIDRPSPRKPGRPPAKEAPETDTID